MRWKIKNFYFIMIFENIAVQMFASLTYLLLLYLGYSLTEIGIFLAVFTATTMVTEIPSGILVDSIGEKTVLLIGYLMRAMGLFFMATAHNFALLLLTAVLTGFAQSLSSGTLESWIVNEIKENNEDYDVAQLFSKLHIISPLFGLSSGFIGAQIIGKENPSIPFYISTVIFISLFLYVLLVKGMFKNRGYHNSFIEIKKAYRETIVNLVDVFKDGRILLFFSMFLVPDILDLGPSNQWQVVLSESVQEYIIGYYIIGIGVATILSNIFLSNYLLKLKFETIFLIDRIILIDILILLTLSFYKTFFPFLFLIHVFLMGITGTLIITYIHDKLVKQAHLRTSIISSFYSLQALASTSLLVLNGYLSDLMGVTSTWIIFIMISLVLFIILRCFVNKKNYNKKID